MYIIPFIQDLLLPLPQTPGFSSLCPSRSALPPSREPITAIKRLNLNPRAISTPSDLPIRDAELVPGPYILQTLQRRQPGLEARGSSSPVSCPLTTISTSTSSGSSSSGSRTATHALNHLMRSHTQQPARRTIPGRRQAVVGAQDDPNVLLVRVALRVAVEPHVPRVRGVDRVVPPQSHVVARHPFRAALFEDYVAWDHVLACGYVVLDGFGCGRGNGLTLRLFASQSLPRTVFGPVRPSFGFVCCCSDLLLCGPEKMWASRCKRCRESKRSHCGF